MMVNQGLFQLVSKPLQHAGFSVTIKLHSIPHQAPIEPPDHWNGSEKPYKINPIHVIHFTQISPVGFISPTGYVSIKWSVPV